MSTKRLSIPPFLQDIHGEKSSLPDLVLTYSGALVSLAAILIIYGQSGLQLPWWKLLLLGLVSADIGAGAIANFTIGTNQYYSGVQKRKSRITFILTHLLHPAIFFYVLEAFSVISGLLVLYVIGATLLINALAGSQKQAVVAAFFMVSGVSLLLIGQMSSPFLLWFFPLYMVKLFLAFGIRRYP